VQLLPQPAAQTKLPLIEHVAQAYDEATCQFLTSAALKSVLSNAQGKSTFSRNLSLSKRSNL